MKKSNAVARAFSLLADLAGMRAAKGRRDTVRLLVIESAALGILAGGGAHLFQMGVSWLGSLRIHLSTVMPSYVILPAFGLAGGILCGLVMRFLSTATTGSGIPQVKASLSGEAFGLDWKALTAKLLAGILALGSGLPLGREGPTVQVGACIAHFFNQLGLTGQKLSRHMVAAGAGAGLAAAFNAPLAGILFVVEELVKDVSSPFVMPAAIACFGAASVSRLFVHPNLNIIPDRGFPQVYFTPSDLPFLLALGVTCGVLGALFNYLIIAGSKLNNKLLPGNFPVRIGIAGLFCGLVIGLMPQSFHDFAHIKSLLAADHPGSEYAIGVFMVNYVLTIVSYGAGAPGGLFGPSLTIGSAVGYLLGMSELSLVSGSAGAPSLMALVGMGAFFAGVARVPITATVIVFEITQDFNLFLPLLIGNITSYLVGEAIYPGSVYDRLLESFFSRKEPDIVAAATDNDRR